MSAFLAAIPQDARPTSLPGTPAPDAGGLKSAPPVAKPGQGMGVGSPVKNCYCVCLCVPRVAFTCFGIHVGPEPADQWDIIPRGPAGTAGPGVGGVGGSSPAPPQSPGFPGLQGQVGGTSIVSRGLVGMAVPAVLPVPGGALRPGVVPPVGPGVGGGLGPAGAGRGTYDRDSTEPLSAARRMSDRAAPPPAAEPPVHRQPSTPPVEYAPTSGTPRLPSPGGGAFGDPSLRAAVIPDDSPRRGWVALASRRAPPPVHPPHAGAFARGLDHGNGAGILPDPAPWYEDGMASTPIGREAAAEFEEPGQGPAVALLEPPERPAVRPVHGTREFQRRDGVMTSGLPGDAVSDLPASVSVPSPLARQAAAWRTDLGAGPGKARATRGVADGPASPGARNASSLAGGLLGAKSTPGAGLGLVGGGSPRPSIRPSLRPGVKPSLGIHTGGGGGSFAGAADAEYAADRASGELLSLGLREIPEARRAYEEAQDLVRTASATGDEGLRTAMEAAAAAYKALEEKEARAAALRTILPDLDKAADKAKIPFLDAGSDKDGQADLLDREVARRREYEEKYGDRLRIRAARNQAKADARFQRRLVRRAGGSDDTKLALKAYLGRSEVQQRRGSLASLGARVANAKNSPAAKAAWKGVDTSASDARRVSETAAARDRAEAKTRESYARVRAATTPEEEARAIEADNAAHEAYWKADEEADRAKVDQARRREARTHEQRVRAAKAAIKEAKKATKAEKRAQKALEYATRIGDKKAKDYWKVEYEIRKADAKEKEEAAKRATADVEAPPESPEPAAPAGEVAPIPPPRPRDPVDGPTFITGELTPENPVDEGSGCGEEPDCGDKPCPKCLEPEEVCIYCYWSPVPVAQKGAGVGGSAPPPRAPADSGYPEAKPKNVEEALELSERVRTEKEARGEGGTAAGRPATEEERLAAGVAEKGRRKREVENALQAAMAWMALAGGRAPAPGRARHAWAEHILELAEERQRRDAVRLARVKSDAREALEQIEREYRRERIEREILTQFEVLLAGDLERHLPRTVTTRNSESRLAAAVDAAWTGLKQSESIIDALGKYYGYSAAEVQQHLRRLAADPKLHDKLSRVAERLKAAQESIELKVDRARATFALIDLSRGIYDAMNGPVDESRRKIIVSASEIEGSLIGNAAGAAYGAMLCAPLGPVGMALGALVFGFIGSAGGRTVGREVAEFAIDNVRDQHPRPRHIVPP